MQTFSFMRRNRTTKKPLSLFTIGLVMVAIVGYCAFSDMFMWLPPLFGVFFVLGVRAYEEKNYTLFYICCGFFLFLEASKSFPLFTTLIFFFISIYWIVYYLEKVVNNEKFLSALLIVWAYLGFYGFLMIVGEFFDTDTVHMSWWLALYIGIEIILAWILL